ncbi:MAG: crossover junction endodeoxyribonuclease RuvC, partial [Gammaproteobacteria bacterium]|nr:crossover junction endodeoxyribonuclease RuvC [Gammaproteobacteria bacterium]
AEYSPRQVKQAVAGYGAAEKDQVKHMVSRLLALQGDLQSDAADALAVAVCHANSRRAAQLLGQREAVQ